MRLNQIEWLWLQKNTTVARGRSNEKKTMNFKCEEKRKLSLSRPSKICKCKSVYSTKQNYHYNCFLQLGWTSRLIWVFFLLKVIEKLFENMWPFWKYNISLFDIFTKYMLCSQFPYTVKYMTQIHPWIEIMNTREALQWSSYVGIKGIRAVFVVCSWPIKPFILCKNCSLQPTSDVKWGEKHFVWVE